MNKNFCMSILTVFILAAAPAFAQQTANQLPTIQDQIQSIEAMVAEDPDNIEHRWKLVSLYCSQAMGNKCAEQAEKIISLKPPKEQLVEAYNAASMGYNYAGKMQKSLNMVNKALEIDPQNQMAQAFLKNLEYSREKFWGGKLPEKLSWYGFETVHDFMQAMQSTGAGMTSPKGQDDCVIMTTGRPVCFNGMTGWTKSPNMVMPNGTRTLLSYSPDDNHLATPSVAVTTDVPPPDIQTAKEFSQMVKDMMAKQAPGAEVAEPKEINVNGQTASLFDMTVKASGGRSTWYQFLIDKTIISVQFAAEGDAYGQHLPAFEKFVNSITIGKPQKGGAFRPPML